MIKEKMGLRVKRGIVTAIMASALIMSIQIIALAGTPPPGPAVPDALGLWTQTASFIRVWVSGLGGAVAFVGVIMFALGQRSEDGERRSSGIGTFVAGAIIIGAAQMIGIFFGVTLP